MSDDQNYEVQLRLEGQWDTHGTYPGDQKDEALEEAANQLSLMNAFDAVRVILEKYDPETGIFNENVIFKRDKENQFIATKAKPRTNISRPGGQGGKSRSSGKAKKRTTVKKKSPASLSSGLWRCAPVWRRSQAWS